MFYIRKKIRNIKNRKKLNFTNFLFLSQKYNLNISVLRLLNLNVFGISIKRFIYIFICLIGCGFMVQMKNINENIILYLQKILRECYLNNELKNLIRSNLLRKIRLNLYGAKRYLQNLPVRGQRTKTNAQTAKKRKKLI